MQVVPKWDGNQWQTNSKRPPVLKAAHSPASNQHLNHQPAGMNNPATAYRFMTCDTKEKYSPTANVKPAVRSNLPKHGPQHSDPDDVSAALLAAIMAGRVNHAKELLRGPRAVLQAAHFRFAVATGGLGMMELLLLEPVMMQADARGLTRPELSQAALPGGYLHRYHESCGPGLWDALIKYGKTRMTQYVLSICLRPFHPLFASFKAASDHEAYKKGYLLAAATAGDLKVVNDLLSEIQMPLHSHTGMPSDLGLWRSVLMELLVGPSGHMHPAHRDGQSIHAYLSTIHALLQHPVAAHARRATFNNPMFMNAATRVGVPALHMLQFLTPPCSIDQPCLTACAAASGDAGVMAWVYGR